MGQVYKIDDKNFDEGVLRCLLPVVVDVWAPWCSPCKILEPILESLSLEYAGRIKFVKMNADDNFIQVRYGITSIPTMLIFHKGRISDRIVGVVPRSLIAEKLRPFILNQAFT